MPAEIKPPELARLIDFAERARQADWSLRSALVRYAQPQPERVGALLELLRRIEAALHSHNKLLAKDGPALWQALDAPAGAPDGPDPAVVGLLRATAELDRLGDTLAGWATDPAADPPDAEVDTVAAAITAQLDDLGVPREQRPTRRTVRG